jgi:hypothetical protein
MLKKPASFVLGSLKSSTYPRGYASGFNSPAASLDGLFEQPVTRAIVFLHRKILHSPCFSGNVQSESLRTLPFSKESADQFDKGLQQTIYSGKKELCDLYCFQGWMEQENCLSLS